MFVVAANSHDWHTMRSHTKQTFQVFYPWSIMRTWRYPLMMSLDLLCCIFGVIWHRIILTCTSDPTLMSNVSLLHEWKWITYNTSLLNVRSLSCCNLSFQSSQDAILHWNLIPIITLPEFFPIRRKWKMLSLCQRSTMSCRCNPITNTLVKVGSLWECSTAATTVMLQLYALKQA